MAEMSAIWLRVAAALYSVGLLHAILTLVRKREHRFHVSLTALSIGAVLHGVSIVEEGLLMNHCPIAFLAVYWRYKTESLGVFIFPLVFVMTPVATLA
jgi:hypothetical protein